MTLSAMNAMQKVGGTNSSVMMGTVTIEQVKESKKLKIRFSLSS